MRKSVSENVPQFIICAHVAFIFRRGSSVKMSYVPISPLLKEDRNLFINTNSSSNIAQHYKLQVTEHEDVEEASASHSFLPNKHVQSMYICCTYYNKMYKSFFKLRNMSYPAAHPFNVFSSFMECNTWQQWENFSLLKKNNRPCLDNFRLQQ